MDVYIVSPRKYMIERRVLTSCPTMKISTLHHGPLVEFPGSLDGGLWRRNVPSKPILFEVGRALVK